MKATILSLALFGLCTTAIAQKVDNSTITSFDLNRYLGKWYEIARFDHSFERDLVGSMAEYSMRDDWNMSRYKRLNLISFFMLCSGFNKIY